MRQRPLAYVALVVLTATTASAEPSSDGQVQLPLLDYQALIKSATTHVRPVPVGYALGKADVQVTVTEEGQHTTGLAEVNLTIDVLDDDWVLVPVLSAGVSVASATLDGEPVQLAPTPLGLCWSTNKAGVHQMVVSYAVDAARFAGGYHLALPVPQAASLVFAATLPGQDLDVSVLPASGTRISNGDNVTQVNATLPTTTAVTLSWRVPTTETFTLSRALYTGTVRGHAVHWSAEFAVEVLGADNVKLKLLPATVALAELKVDGKAASIAVADDFFVTLVRGRGAHKVVANFEVPVDHSDGPPHVAMKIPSVPVSRFELLLPGKKELNVEPLASVSNKRQGGDTVATVYVPMTDTVTLTWNEAIPEAIKTELRANASLYHAVHADEGVLSVRALIEMEVTRGETNLVRVDVPPDVVVNKVSAEDNSVADWRLEKGSQRNKNNILSIFLDRQATGVFTFDVFYERVLGHTAKANERIQVPLLSAVGAHRQKGMVALLSSKEVTLKPLDDKGLTRVGENQLPAFVRQAIELTIATTYKYADASPSLQVQAAPAERKEGKFDAQVDTLISLGDVTMRGAATVEVNVKSGSIMEMQLTLPLGVNFLNLTAPSLRAYKLKGGATTQTIDVQFTQEMEGQFRIEVSYERIMADGETSVTVPTVAVLDAEVEQGRIAVEALAAVEVQPAGTEQLSSLDVKDLPQMLLLKTTNPILLAYKYVHVEPPYKLALSITRHKELEVQGATIDQARYQTLFTRDGLAVTTASFVVRNSRKQFLKVALPPASQVWSVFVDGKPEKPALEATTTGDNSTPSVLIKIINAAQGFPVDLIYATPIAKVHTLGTLSAKLPRPDMVVTQTRWEAYLPDGLTYGTPDANLEVVETHQTVSRDTMAAAVQGVQHKAAGQTMLEPLRLTVPTAGVRFSFEKLYANQADDEATFSIPYASGGGAVLAELLKLLGMLLLAAGIYGSVRPHPRVPPKAALAGAGLGFAILLFTLVYLGSSATLLLVISLGGALGLSSYALVRWRRRAEA